MIYKELVKKQIKDLTRAEQLFVFNAIHKRGDFKFDPVKTNTNHNWKCNYCEYVNEPDEGGQYDRCSYDHKGDVICADTCSYKCCFNLEYYLMSELYLGSDYGFYSDSDYFVLNSE